MLSWLVTDSGRKQTGEVPPASDQVGEDTQKAPDSPRFPAEEQQKDQAPPYVPTEGETLANEASETLEATIASGSHVGAYVPTEEEAASSPVLRRSARKRRAVSVDPPYARKAGRKQKMSTLRHTPPGKDSGGYFQTRQTTPSDAGSGV